MSAPMCTISLASHRSQSDANANIHRDPSLGFLHHPPRILAGGIFSEMMIVNREVLDTAPGAVEISLRSAQL